MMRLNFHGAGCSMILFVCMVHHLVAMTITCCHMAAVHPPLPVSLPQLLSQKQLPGAQFEDWHGPGWRLFGSFGSVTNRCSLPAAGSFITITGCANTSNRQLAMFLENCVSTMASVKFCHVMLLTVTLQGSLRCS